MSKFQVIVADPPWAFSDKLEMSNVPRGAAANYPLLDLEEIKNLRVQDIADPNGCVLALWVPSSLLQDGLDVMKAWGFQQRQTYIWTKSKKNENISKNMRKDFLTLVKKVQRKALKLDGKTITYRDFDFVLDESVLAFGMGRLFRQTHEICILGINSTKIYKSLKNKSQRSVSFGQNLKHSAKPDHLQKSLELMFPRGKKLEIFARRLADGWTTIGNEVCAGEDIRDSIKRLADSINENIAA
jgi:N6-adenosine-specific RNA methylase IME4